MLLCFVFLIGNCAHDFCKHCYEKWSRISKKVLCPIVRLCVNPPISESAWGLTCAALGTGSALAHRAVDSMFSSGDSGSAPAPQPAIQQTLSEVSSACEAQAKAFTDCMSANNGDMGACQFYFDAL